MKKTKKTKSHKKLNKKKTQKYKFVANCFLFFRNVPSNSFGVGGNWSTDNWSTGNWSTGNWSTRNWSIGSIGQRTIGQLPIGQLENFF